METATVTFTSKRYWTDNELMALPKDGRKYELIEGELLMSPVGALHSDVCLNIAMLLRNYSRRKKLGKVYDSSMGFRLSREILLSPDVSFVSNSRLKKIMISPEKFLYGAPDLAVEVLSPGDTLDLIERKLEKYFQHGTRLAWVADPRRKAVTVHSLDAVTKLSRPGETLSGGDALPGFKCKVRQVFETS